MKLHLLYENEQTEDAVIYWSGGKTRTVQVPTSIKDQVIQMLGATRQEYEASKHSPMYCHKDGSLANMVDDITTVLAGQREGGLIAGATQDFTSSDGRNYPGLHTIEKQLQRLGLTTKLGNETPQYTSLIFSKKPARETPQELGKLFGYPEEDIDKF